MLVAIECNVSQCLRHYNGCLVLLSVFLLKDCVNAQVLLLYLYQCGITICI